MLALYIINSVIAIYFYNHNCQLYSLLTIVTLTTTIIYQQFIRVTYMFLAACLVIHTANVLGIFTDPFEFEGDYGPEMNPTRQKVFELVVAKEALSRNLSDPYKDQLVEQSIKEDRERGPTLSELVTPELIQELVQKQNELKKYGFTDSDLNHILDFIEHYGDQKVFHFFRNNPRELLSLDLILRDKAAKEGKSFDLPILSSTQTLKGQNSFELKKDLLQAVFTAETLSLTKPEDTLRKSIKKLNPDFLQQFFGNEAHTQDLEAFCTPAGQTFFYWIYQALNLHLISEDPDMIEQVNKVKELFARTIGEPQARARAFKDKLIAADSGVIFTQESDTFVPQALVDNGPYLPLDPQNPQDGCFVFLRSDLWESDYELIAIEDYKGYQEGRMSVLLATQKLTREKFLLASCHGHSTKAEDGRLQISLVMQKFHELSQKSGNESLQLLIGIDANTKTEEDVKLLREQLDHLGLIGTSVGPTTIKRRMVTTQHAKAGRFAIDEEDYLITLKVENGGRLLLTHPTVGFKEEKPDLSKPLPNVDNPSDHYPVGATLAPIHSTS